MKIRRLGVPLAFAGGILFLARFIACTSGEVAPSPAPEGTFTVPPPATATADAAKRPDGQSPAPDPYASWVPWTELAPTCQTFVPARAEDAPPPIRWEPCERGPELQGLACRRVVVDWPIGDGDGNSNDSVPLARDDGSVVLQIRRFPTQGYLDLLAEPDGRVLFAFLQKDIDTCRLGAVSGDGNHFGYRMRSRVGGATSQIALVGGTFADGKLRLLRRYEDTTGRTITAGNPGFFEKDGALTFYDWSGVKLDTVLSPEGRPMEEPRLFGSTLVFQHGGLTGQALFTYTLAGKRKLFRSFGDDDTRGVADLGSDRKDWVWVEGYGRPPGSRDAFPHVRVMTAKVTSDGGEPVARVVREGFVGYPFGTVPWIVGCGFAARPTTMLGEDGQPFESIIVVRLADGRTHSIRTTAVTTTSFTSVVGLTCDDVFIRGQERVQGQAARPNIFRIRLDSLGPDRLVPEPKDAGN